MCRCTTVTRLIVLPRVIVWKCVACGQTIEDRR